MQLPKGSIPPGALAARELLTEGASLAVWTDCWGGRAVFMSPELTCVELTGELWDILQKIKVATGNRWSGLPDAVAIFPDGRIVMREMKLAGKDKLRHTQHAFARAARSLFPGRIDFEVIEWVGVSRNQVAYGDFTVPVIERDWVRVAKQLPYRKTYLLKPGQRWQDAPVDLASSLSEWYVQLPDGPVPAGAVAARELLAEGASLALWTECYGGGRVVFMSPELTCVEATGDLGNMLRAIKVANKNKWAGLPDAIGIFPDGRVVMRDAKLAGKDKVSDTQHAFARVARSLFPGRVEFGVIEWGRRVAESDLTNRSSQPLAVVLKG